MLERLDPAALVRLAAGASLTVAVLLTLGKLAAALASDSLAVLASMIDSLADIGGSLITFLAVRVSQQPPDRSHRFGHGKAESLSALAQASLVMGSALFVLIGAAERLASPRVIEPGLFAFIVLVGAILITLALVTLQRVVIRRTGSTAIAADRLHYTADLATNLLVLAALALTAGLDVAWIDPVAAVLVALYLAWQAARLGRSAIDTLMDRELSGAERRRIEALVRDHPDVVDLHDLRTRRAGNTTFIELHVEIDGAMSVRRAHRVTDALEARLAEAFGETEIIIHQEPAGLEDDRLDHRIAEARAGSA
ncbi:MAG: cation diffusion facilitator family transporter [Geminicoccaceae bacterium]|jgi:ferrous-iron efflux pump FieF|nr:cation diffusion facilitator family transporter [Geminicoccaceae bacterium]HRY23394.1 cation diffusion facilitator family transporter [Geminicoccaceae bacterium]